MIILEWEIDNQQYGKVKDIITSQLAMLKMVKSIRSKMLTMEILKEFGPTSTFHTVLPPREQLVL